MTRFTRTISHIALLLGFASAALSPAYAGASIGTNISANAPSTSPAYAYDGAATADLVAALSSRPAASRMVGEASPALDFVRFTGAVKNLSLLLLHDVKDEAHVQAAIKRYGFDKVQNAVIKAIRTAQLSHGAEWGDMLAGIYSTRFDAGELHSILREKESSPHFMKLLEEQDEIARAVKDSGKDIYSAARAQVMHQLEASLKI